LLERAITHDQLVGAGAEHLAFDQLEFPAQLRRHGPHAAQRQVGVGILVAKFRRDDAEDLGRDHQLIVAVTPDARRVGDGGDVRLREIARHLADRAGPEDHGHVVLAGTLQRAREPRADGQQRHQHQRDATDAQYRDQRRRHALGNVAQVHRRDGADLFECICHFLSSTATQRG
jgi:hypothetical protein